MKQRFFLLLLLGTAITARSQTALIWSDFTGGIFWEVPSPEELFPGFQKVNFSQKLKDLEGKEVTITGYLLILDGQQSVYLLSQNPMASCFFCGNGGPETVMDLQFAKKPSFEMDALISVTGTLRLNKSDPTATYYKIENADALSFE